MTNEITELFQNTIQLDHLTNEQIDEVLKIFNE